MKKIRSFASHPREWFALGTYGSGTLVIGTSRSAFTAATDLDGCANDLRSHVERMPYTGRGRTNVVRPLQHLYLPLCDYQLPLALQPPVLAGLQLRVTAPLATEIV
jgi:hypothetical protein